MRGRIAFLILGVLALGILAAGFIGDSDGDLIEPDSSCFNVSFDEGTVLVYSGTDKVANVESNKSEGAIGHITVSYDGDRKNVGTFEVLVNVEAGTTYSAKSGISLGTFTINKKTPVKEDFNYTLPTGAVYDGTAKTVTVTLKSPYQGIEGYTTHSENINAGTCNVGYNVTGGQNFNTGYVDLGSFTIAKATPQITTAPAAVTGIVYDGSSHTLINAGVTTGGTLVYSLDSSSGFSENLPQATAPGDHTVYYKVEETGNYTALSGGTVTANISKRDQVSSMANVVFTYGTTASVSVVGLEESPTITYTLDTDSKVSVASNGSLTWISAGITQVTANYEETATYKSGKAICIVTTIKATPEYTAPTAISGLSYTGKSQALINAGSTNGGEFKYCLSTDTGYSGDVPKVINAGNYEVRYWIVGGDYYKDVSMATISAYIAKAAMPTISQKTVEYNGSNVFKTPSFPTGINGETVELTYTAKSANAATYTVSDSLIGDNTFMIGYSGTQNYNIVTVGNLVIKQAELSSISANTVSYSGKTTFTVPNFPTGIGTEKITLTYQAYSSDTGIYTKADGTSPGEGQFVISYSGAKNYKFGYVGNLMIEKATLPAVSVKGETYNGQTEYTTYGFSTGVNDERVTLTYRPYTPDAGTYAKADSPGAGKFTITCSDSKNYKFGSVGNLVIAKATPAASQFTFDQPTDLTYTGTAKTVAVRTVDGVTGMGAVTVKYSDNVNVGMCYVKVDIGDGINYITVSDLQVGNFVILKATNSVSNPSISGWTQGQTPVTPTGSVAQFGTPYYMYSLQTQESYSKTVPTAAGKYYVRAFVDGTDNYDAAKSNATSFEIKSAGEKPTPTKNQFVMSPTSFVYDGTKKTVTVKVADGVTGMGEVKNIAYSDNVNVGKCSVTIDVGEGTAYGAVTGLLIGTFDITSADQPNNTLTYIVIGAMVVIIVILVAYVFSISKRR